ncbi:MAG: HD domain-containing phosphohydrolase [Candidatus Sumerlaeota bacterium]
MALLTRVSAIVVGDTPLADQMNETARLVHEAFGVQACVMRDLRPDGLHLLAVSGFARESLPAILQPDEGIASRMMAERQPITILNVAVDPLTAKLHEAYTSALFSAFAGAPMIVKGEVIGLLGIYTAKPMQQFAFDDLDHLQVVANHVGTALLNARLYRELSEAYDRTLEGWSVALEYRDGETLGHTMRVTELTVKLARTMGWKESDIVHLRRGAILHDIGKIAVPDSILLKPGPLTDEETILMRGHTERAREMLEPIAFLRPALDIPVHHHERWNGSGYPRGLRGENIPAAARIFSVVDVWDALCTDRPYRKAMPRTDVRTYLRENAGVLFEEPAVERFLEMESQG